MTDKNSILTPIDHAMHGLYELLGQLIENGLTPDEARRVLESMVGRVLAIHPATAPALGVTE